MPAERRHVVVEPWRACGVDAHRRGVSGGKPRRDVRASRSLVLGIDGVLEIEDDAVGARCHGLVEALRTISRYEQQCSGTGELVSGLSRSD